MSNTIVRTTERFPMLGRTGNTVNAAGNLVLGLSPWMPGLQPHSCDDITAEWLTSALSGADSSAVVEAFERVGGSSGTTDRSVLKLHWNSAGRESDQPETLFVKATPGPPQNRALVSVLGMARTEVEFYRTARPDLENIAPRALYTECGSGARQMLLLEDLCADGATMFTDQSSWTLGHAEALMDSMAELHGTFWESDRFQGDLAWAPTHTHRHGIALLQLMFRYCRRHIIKNAEELNTSEEVVQLARLLNKYTGAIAPLWDRTQLTLCHGDTHGGNTFAFADGRAGLLDWQVALRAHGLRDVAYFIVTSTPPDLRRLHERDLIDRYLEGLTRHGIAAPPRADAWQLYRMFALDGWDAAMSIVRFAGLQDRAFAEIALRNANAAAEDLDLLDLVQKMAAGTWTPPA